MLTSVKQYKVIAEIIVDFVVLGTVFYLSCQLIPSGSQGNIIVKSIAYASIVLISVGACKSLVSTAFNSFNPVIQLMLNNATGLLIGTCIMLTLEFILSAMAGVAIVAIIASITAFFVLGTLSPLSKLEHQIT